MSASTSENIGDYIAAGLVAAITADGANSPLPAFGPRATVEMPTNRVQVSAGSFVRATDQMAQNGAGTWYYNHRRGILSVMVVTQRTTLQGTGATSNHGVMVGRVRWLCSIASQTLTPAIMGGYQIVDVIDQGDVSRSDETTDTDRTELRFQIDLLIPPANYAAT